VTDPNFACKNCGLSPIILIPLVPDTRNGFNFLNQSTLTLLICPRLFLSLFRAWRMRTFQDEQPKK
jgi:hypothetical protein